MAKLDTTMTGQLFLKVHQLCDKYSATLHSFDPTNHTIEIEVPPEHELAMAAELGAVMEEV